MSKKITHMSYNSLIEVTINNQPKRRFRTPNEVSKAITFARRKFEETGSIVMVRLRPGDFRRQQIEVPERGVVIVAEIGCRLGWERGNVTGFFQNIIDFNATKSIATIEQFSRLLYRLNINAPTVITGLNDDSNIDISIQKIDIDFGASSINGINDIDEDEGVKLFFSYNSTDILFPITDLDSSSDGTSASFPVSSLNDNNIQFFVGTSPKEIFITESRSFIFNPNSISSVNDISSHVKRNNEDVVVKTDKDVTWHVIDIWMKNKDVPVLEPVSIDNGPSDELTISNIDSKIESFTVEARVADNPSEYTQFSIINDIQPSPRVIINNPTQTYVTDNLSEDPERELRYDVTVTSGEYEIVDIDAVPGHYNSISVKQDIATGDDYVSVEGITSSAACAVIHIKTIDDSTIHKKFIATRKTSSETTFQTRTLEYEDANIGGENKRFRFYGVTAGRGFKNEELKWTTTVSKSPELTSPRTNILFISPADTINEGIHAWVRNETGELYSSINVLKNGPVMWPNKRQYVSREHVPYVEFRTGTTKKTDTGALKNISSFSISSNGGFEIADNTDKRKDALFVFDNNPFVFSYKRSDHEIKSTTSVLSSVLNDTVQIVEPFIADKPIENVSTVPTSPVSFTEGYATVYPDADVNEVITTVEEYPSKQVQSPTSLTLFESIDGTQVESTSDTTWFETPFDIENGGEFVFPNRDSFFDNNGTLFPKSLVQTIKSYEVDSGYIHIPDISNTDFGSIPSGYENGANKSTTLAIRNPSSGNITTYSLTKSRGGLTGEYRRAVTITSSNGTFFQSEEFSLDLEFDTDEVFDNISKYLFDANDIRWFIDGTDVTESAGQEIRVTRGGTRITIRLNAIRESSNSDPESAIIRAVVIMDEESIFEDEVMIGLDDMSGSIITQNRHASFLDNTTTKTGEITAKNKQISNAEVIYGSATINTTTNTVVTVDLKKPQNGDNEAHVIQVEYNDSTTEWFTFHTKRIVSGSLRDQSTTYLQTFAFEYNNEFYAVSLTRGTEQVTSASWTVIKDSNANIPTSIQTSNPSVIGPLTGDEDIVECRIIVKNGRYTVTRDIEKAAKEIGFFEDRLELPRGKNNTIPNLANITNSFISLIPTDISESALSNPVNQITTKFLAYNFTSSEKQSIVNGTITYLFGPENTIRRNPPSSDIAFDTPEEIRPGVIPRGTYTITDSDQIYEYARNIRSDVVEQNNNIWFSSNSLFSGQSPSRWGVPRDENDNWTQASIDETFINATFLHSQHVGISGTLTIKDKITSIDNTTSVIDMLRGTVSFKGISKDNKKTFEVDANGNVSILSGINILPSSNPFSISSPDGRNIHIDIGESYSFEFNENEITTAAPAITFDNPSTTTKLGMFEFEDDSLSTPLSEWEISESIEIITLSSLNNVNETKIANNRVVASETTEDTNRKTIIKSTQTNRKILQEITANTTKVPYVFASIAPNSNVTESISVLFNMEDICANDFTENISIPSFNAIIEIEYDIAFVLREKSELVKDGYDGSISSDGSSSGDLDWSELENQNKNFTYPDPESSDRPRGMDAIEGFDETTNPREQLNRVYGGSGIFSLTASTPKEIREESSYATLFTAQPVARRSPVFTSTIKHRATSFQSLTRTRLNASSIIINEDVKEVGVWIPNQEITIRVIQMPTVEDFSTDVSSTGIVSVQPNETSRETPVVTEVSTVTEGTPSMQTKQNIITNEEEQIYNRNKNPQILSNVPIKIATRGKELLQTHVLSVEDETEAERPSFAVHSLYGAVDMRLNKDYRNLAITSQDRQGTKAQLSPLHSGNVRLWVGESLTATNETYKLYLYDGENVYSAPFS